MEDVVGFVFLSEIVHAATMTGGTTEEKYQGVPLLVRVELIEYVTMESGMTKIQLGAGIGPVSVAETMVEVAERINRAKAKK